LNTVEYRKYMLSRSLDQCLARGSKIHPVITDLMEKLEQSTIVFRNSVRALTGAFFTFVLRRSNSPLERVAKISNLMDGSICCEDDEKMVLKMRWCFVDKAVVAAQLTKSRDLYTFVQNSGRLK
jgi:hypothetical protein